MLKPTVLICMCGNTVAVLELYEICSFYSFCLCKNCSVHCWSVVMSTLVKVGQVKSPFHTRTKSIQPDYFGEGFAAG